MSKVLVVDDHPANRKLATGILARAGFEVAEASDAPGALERLKEGRPDVILMDINLPGMDGLSLTRKIKEEGLCPGTKIVAMTAYAMKGDAEKAFAAGCDGYLTKPIDTRALPGTVRAYLGAPASAARGRILAVDDEASGRKLLRVMLSPRGYEVEEASDGLEALERLRAGGIDALITDILMPRMDGYRLCLEIRKDERLRDIPVIVYSASYDSPSDVRLAEEFGADVLIPRPSPPHVVLEALEQQLRRGSRKPAHPRPPGDELSLLKEYSEILVRKLERKNLELRDAQQSLRRANEELEQRVRQRTAELQAALHDLESFSYSVSHDLRAPVRHVEGHARLLESKTGPSAPERPHVEAILRAAARMQEIIEGLIRLSRLGSAELRPAAVDLSAMAAQVLDECRQREPGRDVRTEVRPGLRAEADPAVLRLALENLLDNAWKFTAGVPGARVEFGAVEDPDRTVFFVKDNGAGFDASAAGGLFRPFHRFHARSEFPGTGIGLATARRALERHGGRLWAESAPGKGAVFYFTLGR